MKRFADFGINALDNKGIFPVPVTSISEVINCEIEVLDYETGVHTKHGDDRCVVKIKHDGAEYKFFTASKPIRDALEHVNKTDFPFLTIIKQQKFGSGSGRTFYFT